MNRGFTLIELLIVIAIIGILSATVLVSLNTARTKAQDARRKSDMAQVERALHFYYDKYGNYMEAGSGCGSNGNGWFNYQNGTSYPISMANCLVNEKLTPSPIIDPTGAISSSVTVQNHAYMKYSCAQGTYIYASLATQPRFVDGPANGTCCSGCDTAYGMNYYKFIPR